MRRLFTTTEAAARGLTRSALSWGERTGQWRRVAYGVYGEGPEEPTALDVARAKAMRSGGVAAYGLAAVVQGLDGAVLDTRVRSRRSIPANRIIDVSGLPCTDGYQTLVDIASTMSDEQWEQALESALRTGLTMVAEFVDGLAELGRSRTPGTARMRRVLASRPAGAPPTESLLETLMVQLARRVPGLSPPVRQLRVFDPEGALVARVDLCWPDLGLFIELDGQHHAGQPLYDANRETAVVAATGWLCGRFTWVEVTRTPRSTARRLAAIVERARCRPLAS